MSKLVVKVFRTSINYCHLDKLTTYIKGVERSILKQKLINTKPLQYKKQTILNTKRSTINRGNLYNIKSDPTLRKIRSEARSALDRDKDQLIDLMKMHFGHPEYIKEVAVPFNVN